MAEAAKTIPTNEVAAVAEQVIAECDGDPKAAVMALLSENAALKDQVHRLSCRVSTGYARGLPPGR